MRNENNETTKAPKHRTAKYGKKLKKDAVKSMKSRSKERIIYEKEKGTEHRTENEYNNENKPENKGESLLMLFTLMLCYVIYEKDKITEHRTENEYKNKNKE